MYHWMENVQKYDSSGFNYKAKLAEYVNNDLNDDVFFKAVSNIHVLGCHNNKCSGNRVEDIDDRIRNFEKVLSVLGLQFGSHATAEPPFKAFPGQIPPTPPPTVFVPDAVTEVPSSSPTSTEETVVAQVYVFLTGVPPNVNMTKDELGVFDQLMLDMLTPRLETVNVIVDDVMTVDQIAGANYTFDSNFDSINSTEEKGDNTPVLQAIMNVTLTYKPPPPDGMRDWSIYLKSWIESFGVTVVEIFTTPKHPQHPATSSKFWDELVDVSAKNVNPPPNATEEPTSPPSHWVSDFIITHFFKYKTEKLSFHADSTLLLFL